MNEIRADAKNVKKEYVKAKFIEAAKRILFQDGVSGVTARGIAEVTGYSYATLYHYFSDLNELLLETKLSMIGDMVSRGREEIEVSMDPLQRMKASAKWPIDFFIENPNIFRFFYLYELGSRNETAMVSLAIEKAYVDDYRPFIEKGVIKEADIPVISRTIMYSVYGIITLYLSNNGLKREEIDRDIENIVDYLLKGHSGNEENR